MPKEKEPDPLDLGGLEPDAITHAVHVKTKKQIDPLAIEKEKRLAAREKRLAPTEPEMPPPPPPPLEVDKSALLDKLGAYRERFPHLKKRNNVSVKSAADDILDELHYCEMQLGSRQDGNMGGMLLHGTMVAVEALPRDVWNPLGLNLQGLGAVTKDNMAEFQPIVDELMIKYGAGMYVSPEVRLTLSLCAIVMTVHGSNSGDPRIAAALSKMSTEGKVPSGSKDL